MTHMASRRRNPSFTTTPMARVLHLLIKPWPQPSMLRLHRHTHTHSTRSCLNSSPSKAHTACVDHILPCDQTRRTPDRSRCRRDYQRHCHGSGDTPPATITPTKPAPQVQQSESVRKNKHRVGGFASPCTDLAVVRELKRGTGVQVFQRHMQRDADLWSAQHAARRSPTPTPNLQPKHTHIGPSCRPLFTSEPKVLEHGERVHMVTLAGALLFQALLTILIIHPPLLLVRKYLVGWCGVNIMSGGGLRHERRGGTQNTQHTTRTRDISTYLLRSQESEPQPLLRPPLKD